MSEAVRFSMADLETYRNQGQGRRAGKYLRFFCPIHGGDHQRSLSLEPESGRFQCFTCGAWGYLEEKRQEWVEQKRQAWLEERQRNTPWSQAGWKPSHSNRVMVKPNLPAAKEALSLAESNPEPVARAELVPVLTELQKSLAGSLGEKYLNMRRVSMQLALALGVGYAAASLIADIIGL